MTYNEICNALAEAEIENNRGEASMLICRFCNINKVTDMRVLRTLFRDGVGQIRQLDPGAGGIGGQQQLMAAPGGAQVQQQGIPLRLVDLIHPGTGGFLPDLIQHRRKEIRVKCHSFPYLSRKVR